MNNVKRSAWFCPSCKSTHAPHCDTCPNRADAIAIKVMPTAFPRFGWNPSCVLSNEQIVEMVKAVPIATCAA